LFTGHPVKSWEQRLMTRNSLTGNMGKGKRR
jgi:hypothetical protein